MTEPRVIPDAIDDEGREVFVLADGVDLHDPDLSDGPVPLGDPVEIEPEAS